MAQTSLISRRSLAILSTTLAAACTAAALFFVLGVNGAPLMLLGLLSFGAACFLVAAILDVFTGRIDNILSLAIITAYIPVVLIGERTLVGLGIGLVSGFLFVVLAVVLNIGGGGWIKLFGAMLVWAIPYNWELAVYLGPVTVILNVLVFRFTRPEQLLVPLGPATGTVGVLLMVTQILPILSEQLV